jgi:hypothetical protein
VYFTNRNLSAPAYAGNSIFSYPAYTQNAYARIASGSGWWGATTFGYSNVGVLPSPFNSFNPYISDQIYSAFVDYFLPQSTNNEYAFLTPFSIDPTYTYFIII